MALPIDYKELAVEFAKALIKADNAEVIEAENGVPIRVRCFHCEATCGAQDELVHHEDCTLMKALDFVGEGPAQWETA